MKLGFSAKQVPVSAYSGSLNNLKDLKDRAEQVSVSAHGGSFKNLKDLKKGSMVFLQNNFRNNFRYNLRCLPMVGARKT